MPSLEQMLQDTPYVSYTYSYPHKTAYRTFPAPLRLSELWAQEERKTAFLYLHIPFCEMRCGFCNLFTTVDPKARFTTSYLDALQRQATRVCAALGEIAVARMALGGGTPTYLDADDLARIFDIAERHAAGRAQKTAMVEEALAAIREVDFPTLNIDLIYGLPGQTLESWLVSLRAALRFEPEEVYLYPLYVRPLTGLARSSGADYADSDGILLACYREGRDLLLEAGYTQVSMRMFRASHAPVETGPVYCVQDDGMVGLGCGARSYTRTHHYSSEYAVGAKGVRAILNEYVATPAEAFDFAYYGFSLNDEEHRRRYVIKSLLEADGLHLTAYQQRFGSDVFIDLPDLHELLSLDLAMIKDNKMVLTTVGIERSDTIGPWLYSANVRNLMEGYQLR